MVPSEEIAAGTFAASAGSAATAAAVELEAPPPGEADVLVVELLDPPHAASVRASVVAPARRRIGDVVMGCRIGSPPKDRPSR